MEQLREIYKDKLEILEKVSTSDSIICTGIFAEAGVTNKNNRVYPESVLKNAVEKLQKKIEKDSVLASAGHRKVMEVNNVSHMIENVWYNSKTKTAQCNIKIIPTESGANTMAILRSGGSLGLSLNGIGTTSRKNGVDEVDEGFELKQVDIILSPGFENARFSQKDIIGESLSLPDIEEEDLTLDKEKDKANQKWQDEFMKKTRALYQSSREAGMKLNFKEFVEKFDKKLLSLLEDEN